MKKPNPYLIFLMIELARIEGVIEKELEYDLTWEKGEDLYAEFNKSEFNLDETKGTYGCIQDFLSNKVEVSNE
jgi:hypothetical protein